MHTNRLEPRSGDQNNADFQFPIVNWFLDKDEIGNRQSQIGNPNPSPLRGSKNSNNRLPKARKASPWA